MKIRFAVGTFAVLAFTHSHGLAQEMSYGETEFVYSCAACHGRDGR
jgi:cytochrome c553